MGNSQVLPFLTEASAKEVFLQAERTRKLLQKHGSLEMIGR